MTTKMKLLAAVIAASAVSSVAQAAPAVPAHQAENAWFTDAETSVMNKSAMELPAANAKNVILSWVTAWVFLH